MENIEEKAKESFDKHTNTVGYKKGFIDGYTARNDEVVELIEARKAELLKYYTLAVNQTLYNELTNLLQTIKGDK